jgi:two-component system, OmpR family, response regulator ChvI
MMDSIKIISEITDANKISRYYSIFLNTLDTIAKNFNAKTIKITSDGLIFYFPETYDSSNKSAFKDVIECCLTMIAAKTSINKELYQEKLPSVSYRISADYGRVEVARSTTSQHDDLFGPTMNVCSKINSKAKPNGIVIGCALYRMIKSFSFSAEDYQFEEVGEYLIGYKQRYMLYSVTYGNITYKAPSNQKKLISDMKHPQIHSSHMNKESVLFSKPQKQQYKCPAKVMLVDDEEDMLLTYKSFLEDKDYNISSFSDSETALKHFAETNAYDYDLIILDIRMPGLNGLQLYCKLKEINTAIKVLFVSALDAIDEILSILPDVDSKNIIRKPVKREHFVTAVDGALK